MNTVLILGNGFDLEMGRKTSFKDFYQSEYCPKDYPAPLIRHLNEKLGESEEDIKWYDLENELIHYYKERSRAVDFPDVVDEKERECLRIIKPVDLTYGVHQDEYGEQISSLKDKGFIKKVLRQNLFVGYDIPYQEDFSKPMVWRDRKALALICEGLCKYLKSIELKQYGDDNLVSYQVLQTLVENQKEEGTLNIYNFNYTPVHWDFNGRYVPVKYVHGSCSKGDIIIGTRDDDFDKEYSFLQKSFDKHFSPPPIVSDLQMADEVIIFGHSLGINDRQYFKPFFTAQSAFGEVVRKKIAIITRDDDSIVEIKRSLQELTDNQLSVLMSRNDVCFIKTQMDGDDLRNLEKLLKSHREESQS